MRSSPLPLLLPLVGLCVALRAGESPHPKIQIPDDPGKHETAVPAPPRREIRALLGWDVHVDRALLDSTNRAVTERALALLRVQLEEIVRVVPPAAVVELRKVPLFFSPEYAGFGPRAEFHPDAGWLREHGRDPAMAEGVEFTNVRIFEEETDRMPNFALHELAHAYHYRVLPRGFENPEIAAVYERAKAGGLYDRVECRRGRGRPNTFERAYALTNPQEFFAENTESFFSRNDFFPFDRDELRRHSPETFAALEKAWGVSPSTPTRGE
ncbi:MAG: hypothetical protein JNL97_04905 [Verrucomicrobiales bacterium]|nr:hypothetical protein [Verrucomicrobiales bacterium]